MRCKSVGRVRRPGTRSYGSQPRPGYGGPQPPLGKTDGAREEKDAKQTQKTALALSQTPFRPKKRTLSNPPAAPNKPTTGTGKPNTNPPSGRVARLRGGGGGDDRRG